MPASRALGGPGPRRVIATVGRRLDVLGVGPRLALLLASTFVLALVVIVGMAARQGMLVTAVFAAAGLLAFAVSLRWPLAALILLTVLIPVEQIGTISGFGTVSRLAGILFAVAYAVPRLGSLRLSAMPLLGWAYLGWALLSSGWAIDPGTSWTELPTLLQLFIVGLLIADFVIRRPEIVRPVLLAYSGAAAITAALGVVTYLASGSVDTRAAALQGQNPAQFAAVLLPAFAFGFHEALLGKRRALGAAIAAITLLGILVSGTRGAWLALVVIPPLVMPRMSPKRLAVAGVGLAILIVLALQVPGISQIISDRTGTAISTGGAGRTEIWTVAGVIYRQAPALGVGYANFPVAYTPAVVMQSGVTTYIESGRAPHNIVISSLVELGPLGLVLAAAFLLPLAVRRGWGTEATVIRAAIASTLVIALFLDVLGNRKQVWLFIGLAAGLWWLRQHAQERFGGASAEPAAEVGPPGDAPGRASPVSPEAAVDSPVTGSRTRRVMPVDHAGAQAELWSAAEVPADHSPRKRAPRRRTRKRATSTAETRDTGISPDAAPDPDAPADRDAGISPDAAPDPDAPAPETPPEAPADPRT